MQIGDVDILKHGTMNKSKNTERIWWSDGLIGCSCGYVKPTLGVQEHRRETQIDDVDLFKHDIVKNQRTPKGSGDQGGHFGSSWCPLWALLGPSWGPLGALSVPTRLTCVKTKKVAPLQENRVRR